MRKHDRNRVFEGFHNANFLASCERLKRGNTYKNLSTVWVTATRGSIPAKVVSSWMTLMKPMNQMVIGPIFKAGMEVADAYNQAVTEILANPGFKDFKYMLTVEEDNCPPPDGLLKLYESIERFDVVQGLYWTKGEGGQPMCYGDPAVFPKNFIPQIPPPDTIKEYNGLGMGFNLFKLAMFRKLPSPWFKTQQELSPAGARVYSQDLYFYENAGREGYRFACDTRVKVGHWDEANQVMW